MKQSFVVTNKFGQQAKVTVEAAMIEVADLVVAYNSEGVDVVQIYPAGEFKIEEAKEDDNDVDGN